VQQVATVLRACPVLQRMLVRDTPLSPVGAVALRLGLAGEPGLRVDLDDICHQFLPLLAHA